MSKETEQWRSPRTQGDKPEEQPERAMMQAPDGAGLSVPLSATTGTAEERIELAGGANVHPNDVLCGRGKVSFNHSKM